MKNFFAFLSSAVLVCAAFVTVSTVPASAIPDCLGGTGAESSPWLIASASDFAKIGKTAPEGCETSANQDHFYKLTNDIDLEGENHVPLRLESTAPYRSGFDGDGHVIQSLAIERPNTDQVGLFSLAWRATIKDLRVEVLSISGKDYVGTLAGAVSETVIENVHVSAFWDVIGDRVVGGIAGSATSGTFRNVTFKSFAEVKANSFVGGAIGVAYYTNEINGLGVKATVRATGNYAGGLVGIFQTEAGTALVENTAFIGRVSGSQNVAGLIADLNIRNSAVFNVSGAVIRGFIDSDSSYEPRVFVGGLTALRTNTTLNIRNSYVAVQVANVPLDSVRSVVNPVLSASSFTVVSEQDLINYGDGGLELSDVSGSVNRITSLASVSTLPASWSAQKLSEFDRSSNSSAWLVDDSAGVGAKINQGHPAPTALFRSSFFDKCSPGTFSPDGSTPCWMAADGHFVSNSGATQALECQPGTYQPNWGSTACLLANAGYFVASVGSAMQTRCPVGKYQADSGSFQCVESAPGRYVDIQGATASTPCPFGTTSSAGASSCYSISQSLGGANPALSNPIQTGQPVLTPASVTKFSIRRFGNTVSVSAISSKLLVLKLNGKFVVSQQANKLLKKSVALLNGKNKLEIFEGGKVLKRMNYTR